MTKYPNSIDTNLELPAIIDNVSEISGETINALIEAVIQIEKVLGVNPHGTTLDLTTRLSQILNDDGTFKSAALISSGLISLPITNSQIGVSAAIEESKLDLDITTQSLQNQIDLNEVDIATLQNSLAILITRVSRHVLALAERHDGYDIDISGLTSAPSISTVGQALVFIRDTFLSHVAATITVEHYASAISYEPEEDGIILSTNVQDAIAEFDNTFKESRRQHNSSAHSAGISNDGYMLYGKQAAVNDASARLSTYKSVGARNIVKIGLINSATIKSKDFNPNNLNATTGDAIDVVVRCGNSTKEINITGLNTVQYPAISARPNLTAVVTYLNTQFANNIDNFPVTAFASDDGQIVLQHNISRDDCSITISGPTGTSAIEELGFSEIENIEIFREDIYTLHVNGNPYSELEISTDGYSYQVASSNDIELEDDLSTLSLFNNSLIHIYNHTNSNANGTYRVVVAPGSGTTITLGSALADGYYNYIVYKDSFNLPNTGPDTRLLELFLDKDLNPVSFNRTEESSSIFGILGLKITEISENFPIGTCTLNYTNASSLITTSLQIGSNVGVEVIVGSSYLGEWLLYAPDNYNFVRVLKIGSTAIGTNNIPFDVLESSKTIDKLLLGSVHDSLGNIFELPTNKTNVGLSGIDSIGSDFISEYIENSLGLLHSSGVIKGFTTSFDPGGVIDIEGGICFVGGKKIVKNYTQIQTLNVANYNDDWNLYLDRFGNYRIFNEDDTVDPEYSFRNIINSTEYIAICQFVRSGGVISAIKDARFFVDQNEQKLELTVATENSIRKGKFQTLSAANLYASAYSSSASKTEIIVLADLEVLQGRVSADTSVKVFGNLTANSDLYVEANAKLEVFGDVYVDGQTYLNFQSTLVIHGNANFAISDGVVNMYSGSTLQFENPRDTNENEILINTIKVDGYNVSIIGANSKSRLKFNTGYDQGIYVNISQFFTMKNCLLQRGTSVNPLVELSSASNIIIDNCIFTDSPTLSSSLASISTGYVGLLLSEEVTEIKIKNCLFQGISNAIDKFNLVSSNLEISNNKFINCGEAIVLANGFNVMISNNLFQGLHNVGINIENNNSDKITNLTITNNSFMLLFSNTNSSPNVIKTLIGTYNVNISNNNFHSLINSVSPIDYVMNITGENVIIDGNAIYDTRSDNYLINLNGVDTSCTVSSNTVTNHYGPLLIARNASIVGNSFNDISNGGQTITINATSDDGYSSLFSGNRVMSTDMNDSIYMQGVNISQNNIVVGNAYFVDSDADGNTIDLVGTPADGYGLLLSNIRRSAFISFTNNWVKSIASTSAVRALTGKYNISGNNFALNTTFGPKPLIALSLGVGTSNIQDNTLITSNIFNVGSAYGLWIDASHVSCIGNNFLGTPGSHDIYITNTRTNLHITNNHFRMGSSGIASIFHENANPTACLIRFNKNSLDRYVHSTIDGLTSGTWTTSISLPGTIQLTSGAGTNRVAVSLKNLPQGAQLYSVVAHVLTPGSAGDVNIRLLYRNPSSLTTIDLGSSLGVSSAAVSYQTIEITPSTTHYINSANEYILVITSTVANNSLGQVVAYIKN